MKTLQLQFFDQAQRAYVPAFPLCFCQNENRKSVEAVTDFARSTGKPWRVASTERALKPAYRASGRGARRNWHTQRIENIQVAYVEWANAKGLKHITIYRQHAGNVAFARWYGDRTHITPEEQFAVVESHDVKSGSTAVHIGA